MSEHLMSFFVYTVQVSSVPLMRGWIPPHEIASNLFTTTALLNDCLHWNVRFVRATDTSITVVQNGATTSLHVSAKLGFGGLVAI